MYKFLQYRGCIRREVAFEIPQYPLELRPMPELFGKEVIFDFSKLQRETLPVESLNEDDKCPICLSEAAEDLTENLLRPPCNHCMHVSCSQDWLAKHLQCPICRRAFAIADCVVLELQKSSSGDEERGRVAGPPCPEWQRVQKQIARQRQEQPTLSEVGPARAEDISDAMTLEEIVHDVTV